MYFQFLSFRLITLGLIMLPGFNSEPSAEPAPAAHSIQTPIAHEVFKRISF